MGEGMPKTIRIAPGHLVTIHYTLYDEQGSIIDSTSGEEPYTYIQGYGQVVPGLEKALAGLKRGDRRKVTVDPEEGFGPHDPAKVFLEARDKLDADLEVGHVLEVEVDEDHSSELLVISVQDDAVTLDGNHPLAGKRLVFDVRVVSVRPATLKELNKARKSR